MEVREAGDGAAAGEIIRYPEKKYTWAEVRQAVHDLRKELSSLSTMVPMAISFRKLPNGKTRIYFLRTPHNGWEITLLYTELYPTSEFSNARLDWKPLIDSNVALGVTSGKWSREEQLLYERQRVAGWGIASYELHQDTGRVLFPCASSLFVCEESNAQPPLVPLWLAGAALTPAMCPRRPSLVAYAARGDIWLCGAGLRQPVRLTYACKGHEPGRLADDPRQAGVPCYVMQEEFSRYTGFWWQPQCDDAVYRIAYEEVDESEVKIFSFPSSQSSSGEVEEFRFPRAGSPNAKSYLRLVTFRLQKSTSNTVLDYYQESSDTHKNQNQTTDTDHTEVVDVRWYCLRTPLQEAFPWFEYLARVGWTPCGKYIWLQLLDRKQQRLELAIVPLSELCVEMKYDNGNTVNSPAYCPNYQHQIRVLVAEWCLTAWINVHDILYFCPNNTDPNTVRFIWASEDTGHLHLYLITASLRHHQCEFEDQKGDSAPLDMLDDDNSIRPNIISREAITAGEWEVMGRNIWVDWPRQLVYFIGLRETPLERHLYCASISQGNNVTLLTELGHSHTVDIDQDCTMAVITSSNISSPGKTRVYRIAHNPRPVLIQQGVIMERACSETSDTRSFNGSWDSSRSGEGDDSECSEVNLLVREKSLSSIQLPPPQIYSCQLSCGVTAYSCVWRCGLAGARPTVLHVYGGPEVQTVTNSYKGIRQLRMHMLAARGFNVVAIDSRGSKHRGRNWEAAIKGKMGQVELDDQVEVLQWLAKETGCIDMDRVAIHGWSYGGYLSLLGLATRPHMFKVCIAGAPVCCWRLYDSAYTERYMGLPALCPHPYKRASVLAHAPFFPDQDGRLLIIHGLADENVHFCHTAALLSELVRLGKPHRVQIYPGERHSLRAMHAAKHYEATLLHFLHENL